MKNSKQNKASNPLAQSRESNKSGRGSLGVPAVPSVELADAATGEVRRVEFHKAADLFPPLPDDRFQELVDDIRKHGLRRPITLIDGKVADGRHRLRACAAAGVEPRFEISDGNPFRLAISENIHRRDLPNDQRAQIFVFAFEFAEEWDVARAETAIAANKARSDKAKAQPRTQDGRRLASQVPPQVEGGPDSVPKNVTRGTAAAKAKAAGSSRAAIERAEALKRKDEALALKVARGEVKPTAARKIIKRRELADKVAALPSDQFRVIYADPPWEYNDTREGLSPADGQKDRASTAAAHHYPTMTMSEIKALGVRELAAPDAVLFCWATFPLLPDQLDVVKAWGFTYKTAFVWDKVRGSFGNYHTAEAEILLVCVRGSCTPDIDKRERQIIRIPRTDHSTKPAEWRELIDRLYPHGQANCLRGASR
jgi:ParB-like chromosome segregation protein Spo0J